MTLPPLNGEQVDELLRLFQAACEDAYANGRTESSMMPTAKHRAILRNDIRARLLELKAWEELRRAIAEMIGADVETWPDHGNAPLAIASYVALCALERRSS
jgi:hypothetical protein